jgi:hypothetical protein
MASASVWVLGSVWASVWVLGSASASVGLVAGTATAWAGDMGLNGAHGHRPCLHACHAPDPHRGRHQTRRDHHSPHAHRRTIHRAHRLPLIPRP